MSYLDAQKRFLQMFLLLVFIFFSCFYKVAHAQLSIEECNKKNLDLMMSGFVTTGDAKNFNIVQYKQWSGIKALYQGECSHIPGASGSVGPADKYLQESIKRCEANGQGSNCGVGPIASNSQQNNMQTQTTQSSIATENLDDDPKVFGGGASSLPTKTKKQKE